LAGKSEAESGGAGGGGTSPPGKSAAEAEHESGVQNELNFPGAVGPLEIDPDPDPTHTQVRSDRDRGLDAKKAHALRCAISVDPRIQREINQPEDARQRRMSNLFWELAAKDSDWLLETMQHVTTGKG